MKLLLDWYMQSWFANKKVLNLILQVSDSCIIATIMQECIGL